MTKTEPNEQPEVPLVTPVIPIVTPIVPLVQPVVPVLLITPPIIASHDTSQPAQQPSFIPGVPGFYGSKEIKLANTRDTVK